MIYYKETQKSYIMENQSFVQKQQIPDRDNLINGLKKQINTNISDKIKLNSKLFSNFSTDTLRRVSDLIHDRISGASSDEV